jgi:hypothetical protein
MARKYEVGDVYGPVEDTEVPFSLKMLVFFMFMFLVGIVTLIVLSASEAQVLLGG